MGVHSEARMPAFQQGPEIVATNWIDLFVACRGAKQDIASGDVVACEPRSEILSEQHSDELECLIRDFCEVVPALRVGPNCEELDDLWLRCSSSPPSLVSRTISEYFAGTMTGSLWQSQLRALRILTHFYTKGPVGRAIADGSMASMGAFVRHLAAAEDSECREEAAHALLQWQLSPCRACEKSSPVMAYEKSAKEMFCVGHEARPHTFAAAKLPRAQTHASVPVPKCSGDEANQATVDQVFEKSSFVDLLGLPAAGGESPHLHGGAPAGVERGSLAAEQTLDQRERRSHSFGEGDLIALEHCGEADTPPSTSPIVVEGSVPPASPETTTTADIPVTAETTIGPERFYIGGGDGGGAATSASAELEAIYSFRRQCTSSLPHGPISIPLATDEFMDENFLKTQDPFASLTAEVGLWKL